MGAYMFWAGPECDEKEFEEKVVGHVNTYSIPTDRQDVSWSCRATECISSMILVRGARIP
jgi:hypothetical protein